MVTAQQHTIGEETDENKCTAIITKLQLSDFLTRRQETKGDVDAYKIIQEGNKDKIKSCLVYLTHSS